MVLFGLVLCSVGVAVCKGITFLIFFLYLMLSSLFSDVMVFLAWFQHLEAACSLC